MTVENHYVLVIHGTFNAPSPGERKWYQPPDASGNFCSRLQERLTRVMPEMQGAVWRTFDVNTSFRWSGHNDHGGRLRAAYRLYETFKQIIESDPTARIHVVAHSHGGNVLLGAVEILLDPHPESHREIAMSDMWRWYFRGSPRLMRLFKLDRDDPIVTAAEADAFRSSAAHLGRLVFLGTPFVRKQWTASMSPRRRLFTRLVGNLPAVVTGSAAIYALAIVASAIPAFTPWASFIGANPFRWPQAWQLLVGAFTILFGVVILFDEARYNSNLYFAEHRYKRQLPPAPFPALVISARLLDEALLALSMEPLVAGELAPRVDELLHPERSWPLHRLFAVLWARWKHNAVFGQEEVWVEARTIGRYWAAFSNVGDLLPWLVRLVLDGAYCATFFFWYALQKGMSKLVSRVIRDSLAAASLGLPGGDLRGARLEISQHLRIDAVFAEEFWDVSKIVLQAPFVIPIATSDRRRYAYLLDDDALRDRLEAEESRDDSPWLRLKGRLGALYDRYASSFAFDEGVAGRMSRADYDRAMARIRLTLVERFREVSGAIELAHSAYYANPEIEDGIANFIATGSPQGNSGPAVSDFIWEGNPNDWDVESNRVGR